MRFISFLSLISLLPLMLLTSCGKKKQTSAKEQATQTVKTQGEKLIITSDHAHGKTDSDPNNPSGYLFSYDGNVHVRGKKLGHIQADKLTVVSQVKSGKRDIGSIIATPVILDHKTYHVTGDTLVYNPHTGNAEITGSVKIEKREHQKKQLESLCERVIIDTRRGKVTLERAGKGTVTTRIS